MAPHVPSSRTKLGYPLYAADFDPLNADFLLVGGGGGSSSTGVPNKISLLDVSRQYESREITDIELANDEDSVTTLAVASSSDTSLSAIAGINSSLAEQEAGRNEHFRTFRIGLPARIQRANGMEISEPARIPTQSLGKTALFKSALQPKNETYQRVLRASPLQSSSEARITAIASGLAPENEIVAFQPVSNALTSTVDEISRISLGKIEAADVDVMAVKGSGHVLAYCTDDSVYVQQLPNTKGSRIDVPIKIYQSPASTEASPSAQRAKLRALRFLTPKHILLLLNRPGRTGAALLILKINITGNGHITLTKRLHKSIKLATGLDTCILRSSATEDFQAIIAVASQDSSIELLTIDYTPTEGLSTFRPFTLLKEVHNGPLTRIVFSNYIPTSLPTSSSTPAQRIKLASVGLDQNVVVQTLSLGPLPSSKSPRYVLHPPGRSEGLQTTIQLSTALIVVILAALLMQAFCEIRGVVAPTLGVAKYLPAGIRDTIARPYPFGDTSESGSQPTSEKMSEALSRAIEAIKDAPSHIIIPSSMPTSLDDSSIPSTDQAIDKLSELVQAIKDAPSHITIPTSLPTATDDLPIPSAGQATDKLADIVSSNSELETPKAIVVRDTGSDLSTELHHNTELIKEQALKKWDDLTAKERRGWKEKLKATGHWVEQQGENVLKGVLFSELAGAVGDAVRN